MPQPAAPEITSVGTEIDSGEIIISVEMEAVPASAAVLAVGLGADGEAVGITFVEDNAAVLPAAGVKTVKVFVWESMETLRPLCEAKEAEI